MKWIELPQKRLLSLHGMTHIYGSDCAYAVPNFVINFKKDGKVLEQMGYNTKIIRDEVYHDILLFLKDPDRLVFSLDQFGLFHEEPEN